MASPAEIKVLIVDDSITVREITKKQLEEKGIGEIHTAPSGTKAVSIYKEVLPNLVLLDINMPEMNGIQALEEIMKLNNEAHVVMLSSLGTKENVKETLALGAKNFLMKPIDSESLDQIIDELLKQI